jgi:hypothetical protein
VASALAGGVVAAGPAQAASQNSVLVAPARASEPVGVVGETFFTKDVYINTTSANVTLSGSADGGSSFYVDDLLMLQITRPDGTVVTVSADDSNNCTASTVLSTNPIPLRRYLATAPAGTSMYKLSFTFSDACGGDDGNSPIYLSGDFTQPSVRPSLPSMDGGTFVDVHHKPGQGTFQCTAGFSVRRGGVNYMLLAKHCFDSEHPQDTNQFVAQAMPVTITTLDPPYDGSQAGTNDKFAFATELSCSAGPSACLLPPNSDGAAGDVVAFKPDAAVPSDMVQTKYGLLPVLGERTLAQLPKGQQICHYGFGSWHVLHKAEQCGTSLGTSGGLGKISAQGIEGDSGGPVYVYVNGQKGRVVGVYALGTTVTAGTQGCDHFFNVGCQNYIQFIPIATTEAGLNASLV